MNLYNFASQIGIQTYGNEFSKYEALAFAIQESVLNNVHGNIRMMVDQAISERDCTAVLAPDEAFYRSAVENQTIEYSNLKNEVERKTQVMAEEFNKIKDGNLNVIKQMEATFDKQKKRLIEEMHRLFAVIVEDKTSVEAQRFLEMLEKA